MKKVCILIILAALLAAACSVEQILDQEASEGSRAISNPYNRIEAEAFNLQAGVQKENCAEGGQDIGYIHNGDYVAYNSVNFSQGTASFEARVASGNAGGRIEVRLDGVSGQLLGTLNVSGTGGWQKWVTVKTGISSVSGTRNLYLVFKGGSGYLLNLNWFSFAQGGSTVPTPTPAPTTPPQTGFKGRIAVSSDGNQHDKDDWGATATTLAIIAAKGLQSKLVHYDHSNHLGNNNSSWENAMIESAENGAVKFKYNTSAFYNDQKNLNGAVNSLAAAVNASSSADPLYIIAAGPMEVVWRGINKGDSSKRQYVTVISHSSWNNNHQDTSQMSHDSDDVKKLGIKWVQIKDQNGGLNTKGNWAPWDWMKNSSNQNIKWIWDRMKAEGKPDISDAGMAYYLLTGDQDCNSTKLKNWLQ